MYTKSLKQTLTLGVLALSFAGATQAVDFTGSGFLTLAAGKVIDRELADGFVVVDYGQAGIYDDTSLTLGPDSRLGLQGTATFSPEWSATGQIVSRGAANGKINLEWLYATYQATDDLTIQIGRKRLPLFYYSESQDVGIALPWVRIPPQAYGWDVVNYNGANLMYRSTLGEWTSNAEVFFGNEERKNNPYQQIYSSREARVDEKWTNIMGADWSLNRDWLELRFSAVRSGWETTDTATATREDNGKQTFLSAGAMIDYENWLIRSEVSKIDRPDLIGSAEHDWALLLGVGYRYGKWLPMVTYAKFHGNYEDPTWADERTENIALSLRYDLTSSSAIKLQYDIFRDQSDGANGMTCYRDPVTCGGGPSSERYGDARMITIAYDKVF